MPRIAEHCQPEGWRYRSLPHTPAHPWPEDAYVQWGPARASPAVEGQEPKRLCFFEVFTQAPEGFIRATGTDVASAEATAWGRFVAQRSCPEHVFVRERALPSGAASCVHCGFFVAGLFEPRMRCCVCQAPTYHASGPGGENGARLWYCEAHVALRSNPAPGR